MIRTRVGYAGGTTAAPTYRQMGDHAESLQVDFDPTRLRLEDLLELFWEAHSPQRPAYSRQYMAALFFADERQEHLAKQGRDRIAAALDREIHTVIEPLATFHRAEHYHQKYYLRRRTDLMRLFESYSPDEFVDSTVAARLNGYVGGHGLSADLLELISPAHAGDAMT